MRVTRQAARCVFLSVRHKALLMCRCLLGGRTPVYVGCPVPFLPARACSCRLGVVMRSPRLSREGHRGDGIAPGHLYVDTIGPVGLGHRYALRMCYMRGVVVGASAPLAPYPVRCSPRVARCVCPCEALVSTSLHSLPIAVELCRRPEPAGCVPDHARLTMGWHVALCQ